MGVTRDRRIERNCTVLAALLTNHEMFPRALLPRGRLLSHVNRCWKVLLLVPQLLDELWLWTGIALDR
jgi:hypothetical protein